MTIEEIKQLVNRLIIENYTGDISAESVNRILTETLHYLGVSEEKMTALNANVDSLKDILPNEQRDKFVVADAVGNIMLQVDKEGVHFPTVIDEKSHKDGFYITDALGYVIFKADRDGVQFAGNSGEGNNWLFGKNVFSLGDSLSEANVWQRKLAQLTGCVFSSAKNTDPSKPISVGGTATLAAASGVDVAKCGFQRARNLVSLADAKDVVIIENINDINYLSLGGSISDLPYMQYADGSNNGNPRTLYAAYKGLVEYLRTNLPESLIMWLIPTRFGTSFSNPFRRADGSLDIDAYKASDTNYQRLVSIQKEVADYYGIPVLDMQKESGINYINGSTYYFDNNVHPKQIGYERWGATIARLITGK